MEELKEHIICKERVCDGVLYTYKLILNDDTRLTSIGIPLYSISIDMTVIESGKHTSAHTKEIFSDEEKALAFLDKLVNGLATPIALAYIVEDELYT